jgi:hypothetical protein
MSEPTDRQSAAWTLATVLELAGRLDLDHDDQDYIAEKADQLAGYARSLARDLRLVARGRRVHQHLASQHGGELPERDGLDLWNLLDLHRRRHTSSPPPADPHSHPDLGEVGA